MEYPQDVDVDVDGEYEDNGVIRGSGEDESETDQVVQSLWIM